MRRANDVSLDSVHYRRFSDSQLDRLVQAALEILEDIGIRFAEPEAVDILRRGGATVDGDLVRIPSSRVEWALRAAPKRLHLYDQTGGPALRLQGRCAWFGNGSDLPYIIDHRTGARRKAVLQDVRDILHLLEALEHIDFVMSGFLPQDVPVERTERLQMQVMLQYTNKPMVYVTTDLDNTCKLVAMAEAVAGGAETLRARPFAACYINITNPLRHNPESLQKLIWLARKGLPFDYRPSLITRGITTPITGAGFLAVNSAAVLAGLVLAQLVREGAPFISDSCAGGTFDMGTMVGQLAGPEIRGFNEDLLHRYGLPGFGNGAMTGSKTIDTQAGMEAALTLLTAVQAGAQLIHDVGYMDNGATGSLEQLLVCHDLLGWVKAYMKPLPVEPETLDLDTVRQVVASNGNFLGARTTARHFRDDYYPDLIDRQNFDGWLRDGGLSMRDRARARVEEMLAAPAETLLTPEQDRAVQAIVDE